MERVDERAADQQATPRSEQAGRPDAVGALAPRRVAGGEAERDGQQSEHHDQAREPLLSECACVRAVSGDAGQVLELPGTRSEGIRARRSQRRPLTREALGVVLMRSRALREEAP
jgi:hypothetical protein